MSNISGPGVSPTTTLTNNLENADQLQPQSSLERSLQAHSSLGNLDPNQETPDSATQGSQAVTNKQLTVPAIVAYAHEGESIYDVAERYGLIHGGMSAKDKESIVHEMMRLNPGLALKQHLPEGTVVYLPAKGA